MAVIKTFRDLDVYVLAHDLAVEIFQMTKNFPPEEMYSLTNQIRRSSRSAAVNIAEGWGKRRHENLFKRHLIDSAGSVEETKSWLLFSVDYGYVVKERYDTILKKYEELGAKLFKLHDHWHTYT